MVKLSGLPPPLEHRRLRDRVRPALILFAVALLLRVGYAWIATGPGATPSSDPLEYDQVAWNLASGAGFRLGEGANAYPTAFVPPVLPWIVSLLYGVIGRDYFSAVLLQCVVGAFVPLLTVALGTVLFGPGPGRVAGWLAAVHPLLIFFSAYLLTETTFCVTLLLALLAATAWVRRPDGRHAFLAGLAIGIAILTRPTALVLPVLVAAWAWRPLGLMLASRARLRQLAVLALGVALVVGPWTLRNALTLGAFVPLTTGGGRALLDSNNPMAWDDPALRGGAAIDLTAEPYATLLRGGSEPERDARARAHAWAFIRSRPGDWPGVAGAKIARFWRVTAEGGGTGTWQRPGSTVADRVRGIDPLFLWSICIMPFALAGLWLSLKGPRRWFQSLAPATIACFTLMVVIFWGSLRLRVPIEPLVVMLAALAIERTRTRLGWRLWAR